MQVYKSFPKSVGLPSDFLNSETFTPRLKTTSPLDVDGINYTYTSNGYINKLGNGLAFVKIEFDITSTLGNPGYSLIIDNLPFTSKGNNYLNVHVFKGDMDISDLLKSKVSSRIRDDENFISLIGKVYGNDINSPKITSGNITLSGLILIK
ncbi:hypothetical protein [Tenacibaculum ovolyticum]|uniref:hypothetical protein n=1 Tax=Tenacibaculum ovolyticum TaxID=104270 RepID=UPI001F19F6B8|nr:hypothetical protein [Tenacibaculum ovolyticum]